MKSIFLVAAVLLSATGPANPILGSGKVGQFYERIYDTKINKIC
jgi:hypothetical protein